MEVYYPWCIRSTRLRNDLTSLDVKPSPWHTRCLMSYCELDTASTRICTPGVDCCILLLTLRSIENRVVSVFVIGDKEFELQDVNHLSVAVRMIVSGTLLRHILLARLALSHKLNMSCERGAPKITFPTPA